MSATETVNAGSIPDRVKLKAMKIGVQSFSARRLGIREKVYILHHVWWTGGQVAAWLEDRKICLLSPGRANLVNKREITNKYLLYT